MTQTERAAVRRVYSFIVAQVKASETIRDNTMAESESQWSYWNGAAFAYADAALYMKAELAKNLDI